MSFAVSRASSVSSPILIHGHAQECSPVSVGKRITERWKGAFKNLGLRWAETGRFKVSSLLTAAKSLARKPLSLSWRMKLGLSALFMSPFMISELIPLLAKQGQSLGSAIGLGAFGMLGSVITGVGKGSRLRALMIFRSTLLGKLARGIAVKKSEAELLEILRNEAKA
ncbi:MAG TPA: hypothetical protein DF383_07070, partial [Deltaproteobacteria bacterium]|nr:hypothetical protein [Deltaproteobacteria bacterium]